MPRDKCTLYKGVLPPVEWSILFPPTLLAPTKNLKNFESFSQNKHTHTFFPPGPLLQPIETLKKNPTILRSQRNAYIRLYTLQNTCSSSFTHSLLCSPTPMHASFSILMPSMLSHPCSFYLCPLSEFVSPFVHPMLRLTTDSCSLR